MRSKNCKSAGCVTGNSNVGGLIGQESSSNDSTCYSVGSVNGSVQFVGGLIGYQYGATTVNCYSTGTVKGSAQYAGGLVAYQIYSTATNCYSAGPVTGAGYIGGLIGNQYSSTTVNCFWDVQTSGQTSSAGGSGKSTADMKSYLTFCVRGWPLKGINGTIWNIGNGRNNGYPYLDWQYPGDPAIVTMAAQPSGSGTSGDPYQIATLSNLYWMTQDASRWSMVYKQTADIDASSTSTWEAGAGFLPIGDAATAFNGSYDGQTYKITHLFINRSTTDNIGLFGNVSGATITNVKLDSVKITGNNNVGGFIGQQNGSSTATNCYSTGSVTGAGNNVGGLIGYQQNTSTVANCKSAGCVTGASNVGGLIGYQYNGCAAKNCKSAGCVTGNSNVGGLIGQESSSNDSTCYSVGSVNGSVQFVGGLIGYQYGATTVNCYSTDTVKGSAQYAGGLVAYQIYSTATNCYSAGPVTGAGYVGGLIGNQYSSTTVNCFWDVQTSGQTSSAGGSGKNPADMKSYLTFSVRGWPLKGINGTIWNIGNGRNNGYPYLDWQYPGDPAIVTMAAQPSGSGTSGDPYQIATLSNLYWMTQDASRWSMVYRQTADIDATSSSSLDAGAGFLPIGDATTAFNGSYDGQSVQNHTFIYKPGHNRQHWPLWKCEWCNNHKCKVG